MFPARIALIAALLSLLQIATSAPLNDMLVAIHARFGSVKTPGV